MTHHHDSPSMCASSTLHLHSLDVHAFVLCSRYHLDYRYGTELWGGNPCDAAKTDPDHKCNMCVSSSWDFSAKPGFYVLWYGPCLHWMYRVSLSPPPSLSPLSLPFPSPSRARSLSVTHALMRSYLYTLSQRERACEREVLTLNYLAAVVI